MDEQSVDGHLDRAIAVDVCPRCQAFWFDAHESLGLTPGATLGLFRLIGEHSATRADLAHADVMKCPRCGAGLHLTHDLQRATRFEYWRCANGHGRFTTFFDFLREKDFVRPLTPRQIAELRRAVQTVNCANCGAPVDLGKGGPCPHCGTPLSMLDMQQAESLVRQLREAARPDKPVDPTLPMRLAQARREVDAAFQGLPSDPNWMADAQAIDLIAAGVKLVARWIT
jgi:endogenous inhibitor of DNA gyrase (YacG/DUF329 family)